MKVAYSAGQLSARVAAMGRAISRDYAGRTLHVVTILENAFLFSGDLVRQIRGPVVCHFVRLETREIHLGGFPRREIFFSHPPALAGRDVLLVDTVLHTGVTQDFLMKRLETSRPRSLRMAVLFDKPQERKVDLKAAYTGFAAASKHWVGYGLAGRQGLYRNLPYVGLAGPAQARVKTRRRRARAVKRTKGSRGRGKR